MVECRQAGHPHRAVELRTLFHTILDSLRSCFVLEGGNRVLEVDIRPLPSASNGWFDKSWRGITQVRLQFVNRKEAPHGFIHRRGGVDGEDKGILGHAEQFRGVLAEGL